MHGGPQKQGSCASRPHPSHIRFHCPPPRTSSFLPSSPPTSSFFRAQLPPRSLRSPTPPPPTSRPRPRSAMSSVANAVAGSVVYLADRVGGSLDKLLPGWQEISDTLSYGPRRPRLLQFFFGRGCATRLPPPKLAFHRRVCCPSPAMLTRSAPACWLVAHPPVLHPPAASRRTTPAATRRRKRRSPGKVMGRSPDGCTASCCSSVLKAFTLMPVHLGACCW